MTYAHEHTPASPRPPPDAPARGAPTDEEERNLKKMNSVGNIFPLAIGADWP